MEVIRHTRQLTDAFYIWRLSDWVISRLGRIVPYARCSLMDMVPK